jgi:hypothetical protein
MCQDHGTTIPFLSSSQDNIYSFGKYCPILIPRSLSCSDRFECEANHVTDPNLLVLTDALSDPHQVPNLLLRRMCT